MSSNNQPPFRAVCINVPGSWPELAAIHGCSHPVKGEIVEVILIRRSVDPGYEHNTMYVLKKHGDERRGFQSDNFAPITYSDITAEIAAKATETKEQPDKIVINEPVNN